MILQITILELDIYIHDEHNTSSPAILKNMQRIVVTLINIKDKSILFKSTALT